MKLLTSIIVGVTLLLALSPFTYAAAPYVSYGPQTYQDHKYYYFGDSSHSALSRNGIDISVDTSSISYQSVKATVTMDYNLIMDRGITKFIVLANGINVDEFEPYFDRSLDPIRYKEYYYLDINVSNQYIGAQAYFQVVALHQDDINTPSGNVYVTAWSQESPTIHMKPLPVTDSDTHGLINESNNLLQQILDKLDKLRMDLLMKLDQLQNAVEKIYTVTPETQSKFDLAMQNLQDKLPTQQIQEQMNEAKEMLDDSADQIKNTEQKLVFGRITWMGTVTTDALNFTEMEQLIEKMRKILQIALWCEFFYGIFLILRPRLTI